MTQLMHRFALAGAIALAPMIASAGTVATGQYHTVLRASDGTVWTWGYNANGQLGIGSTTQKKAPTQVTTLTGVSHVAAGPSHSAALKSNGTVWTWGYNANGRLGDGTTTQRTSPVQVSGLTSVTAIACGDAFCLAVKTNGTVWSWGLNTNGQLGDGTVTQRTAPVQVSGLTGAASVSAGSSHSVCVKTDGTVWSWGLNSNGQLGDGSTTQRLAPVAVSVLTSVSTVASSLVSNRALESNGTVWAWGSNASGQLGDGTTTQRTTPVQITGLSGAAAIGGGAAHGLGATSDTLAWAWGANASGQVGDGSTTARTSPVQVPGLTTITLVATGGGDHSIAITSDGIVWAWGRNNYGQVGDGTTLGRLSPVQLSEPNYNWFVATPTMAPATGTYSVNQNVTVATVTAGATIHYTKNGATPTTSDPTVASGATVLIDGSMTLKARAVKSGMPASNVASETYTLKPATPTFSPGQATYTTAQNVTIACSTAGTTIRYTTDGSDPTESSALYSGAIAVATTTTVKAKAFKTSWDPSTTGTATYTMNFGTLAAPTTAPAAGTFTSSVAVSLGATNGAAIRYTLDGSTPTTSSALYSAPLNVVATTTIKAKAFHSDYTASAVTTGAYTIKVAAPTFSPGAGAYTAGQAITVATATPGATIHYTLTGSDPTTSDPTLASGGTLVAGNYTLKSRAFKSGCDASLVETATYSTTGATAAAGISAGKNHSIALESDGTVWSWGANASGQLGDGTTTLRKVPVQVSGLTGITSVSAGGSHTLALRSDGTVWAFGANAEGQLGDGTTTLRSLLPIQVPGLTGVASIAAGSQHSVAVKSDGTVMAWGGNAQGQLGDGTVTRRTSPVTVSGAVNVAAVSARGNHTLALKTDGSVLAWGQNSSGQLGDGTTTQRQTPVVVTNLDGACQRL